MTVTWYDIKLKTMQKMFAINNGSTRLPTDSMGKDYLSAMPGAANEALQMLATAGKFIIKSIDIAHIPVRNLIPSAANIRSVIRGSLEYSADAARSMYYEVKGVGTMTVTVGDNTPVTTSFDTRSSLGYVGFKQLISNADDLNVLVTFESDYPLSVKNFAFYDATYETENEIPPYSEYTRYYLPDLADDFYEVDPEHIIYEGDCDVSRYMATSWWFQESFKVFLLPRDLPGNYKLYYKAYPQPLTLTTPDETELVIDPEVAALLPLYMASQIYKDDDISMATQYRNEFEVAFDRLKKSVTAPSQERFTSVTGWI